MMPIAFTYVAFPIRAVLLFQAVSKNDEPFVCLGRLCHFLYNYVFIVQETPLFQSRKCVTLLPVLHLGNQVSQAALSWTRQLNVTCSLELLPGSSASDGSSLVYFSLC